MPLPRADRESAPVLSSDGFEATEIDGAALDENKWLADARENGGRRAKHEGAGRSRDEQGHGAQKRFAEWKAEQWRDDDDQRGEDQHGGNKDAFLFNRLCV